MPKPADPSPSDPLPRRLTPTRVALLYAAFASLWIIVSGYLLTITVADPVLQGRIEIAKGLLFVAVTSLLVYTLARRLGVAGVATDIRTSPSSHHPLAVAIGVALVAALASGLLVRQSEQQRQMQQRAQIANIAGDQTHAIQRNIEHALSATHALAALVRQGNGKVPDFTRTASEMLKFYPGATALQLAPNGIIRHVVPLAGNEKAIGHNLLQDPARNKEAFLARDSGKLTLAGPFDLVQGGLGAVGRQPVYLGSAKPEFWGFTTVLIRFPQVLNDIRLTQMREQGYAYELWRIHPDSGQRQIIAASGTAPLPDPVDQSFALPNGRWTLSVAPIEGWSDPYGVTLKAALGLLFSLLLGYLAKLLVELRMYKDNLETLVAQRTLQLSTSEQRFRNISDAAGAYLWEIDTHMVYTYVSGQSVRVKGYPPEHLIGHTPMEFMPPEDIQPVGEIVNQAIANKSFFRLQHRDITPSGEVWWEEVYGSVYCDENGEVIGLRGTGMSINARKMLEMEREEYYRFFTASSEMMGIADPNGAFKKVNPAFLEKLDYPEQEILSRPFIEFIHPDDRQPTLDEMARQLQRGYSLDFQNRYRHKDGSYRWLSWRATYDQQEGVTYAIATDITERKQAEEELRRSERRFRDVAEVSADWIWEVDATGRYTYISDGVTKMLGYGPDECIGKTPFDFMAPAEAQRIGEVFGRIAASRQAFSNLENIVLGKDGTPHVTLTNGTPILDAAGGLLGYRGIDRDISAHRMAEQRVQRLTNLYAALSECNQAIVRCNSEMVLFPEICQDVVRFGGMKMAWIGILDTESRQVRPVASFGAGLTYLEDIHITMDADDPHGRGPVGTAIRENRPVWNQDFQRDPVAIPWREDAEQFGWGSVAALPLHRNSKVIGSFNLYAGEVNAFDEDARKLLEEMAADISYALDGFERDASLRLAAEVFEQGKEGIMITNTHGKIVRVNHAFCEISGYSEAEALGQGASLLSSGRQSPEFYREMWQSIDATGHWQGEIWNRRKDGNIYPEWLTISRVLDGEGRPSHYVGIFSDITQHKEADARIQRLAHFDALTGLPNRALLYDRARHAISMAQRGHEQLSVLFVDLDHFKNINDTLGHRIGDELLVEVGRRMKAMVREEDTISRQGGDEFIVVLPNTDADGAAHVARKLIEAVAMAFKVEQYELVVTPSIGIAMYPSNGENFETLSQCADTAMYRAKQEGRNTFRFFTPEMQEHSARSLQLEGALRHALARKELHLHYQPQVSLLNGRIIGAEALLRWQHPELGPIAPAEFIPIAEDAGLILPIGEWVLRTAVRQMKAWLDTGMEPMVMAVNLSAVQFGHAHLAELVAQILAEEGLAPQHLELELTEGVAMDDPLAAIAVMDDLHERGIRVSIDDFGTGYSSLSYLKRFQVYKLKIDQSFVRDITTDPEDRAIVSAIISLANSLGLRTIAEGVESEDQLTFLREYGCQEVQGYYYSKPLTPEAFAAFAGKFG